MQARNIDIDNFIMDSSRHGLVNLSAQNSPAGATPMGNSPFMDINFPYQDLSHTPEMDVRDGGKLDHHSDHFGMSTGSSQLGAITSTTPSRIDFQSKSPLQARMESNIDQSGSVDGSDGTTPESNQARGASVTDGFDEFGIDGSGAADGTDLGKQKEEKSQTPAWTELKTKAGKERKRLPLACIACRRKKIRCSGEKPACKHCLRSRIPCVYKVTTRKAAPRTDYMAMLDKRLKRMEERIIKIVPKEEFDPTAITRAQVKPAIPGTTPTPKPTNVRKRPAEEAFGPELENWSNSTIKNNEAGVLPASLLAQEQEESKLLIEGAQALPSTEIQEHLAEVFFDNLYGQAYHVLHKPSFMRKLKAGTVPPVLILAVCAVSARFSTHPKVSSTPAFLRGEEWAKEARDIVLKRYEWPNITILTCLLILGLHEFGTCYGGRSWALGGMAIRMAYALQLHRDLDHDPCKPNGRQLSFIDREIRRRTMWACFVMDRFNSSGTDRPMFIKEESIKVQLPCKEKMFRLDMDGPTEDLQGNVPYPSSGEDGQLSDPEENMGVAAFMLRSIALWGRIILYHFQGGKDADPHKLWDPASQFHDLVKQTEEFVAILPESLQYTADNLIAHNTEGLANQFLFLHISSQQNILLLNHIAVHGNRGGRAPKDTPLDFFVKRTSKAYDAAKRISELLRDVEIYPVAAPFVGYCAFLSSTVQMTAAFSKNPETEAIAKRNLATNVRYLSKMKRYWGAFHWTSEQLKLQFRSCADAAKQGPGAAGSQPAVSQYSDWFDRYPHGVSQTDFEDPAVAIKKEKGDDAVLEHKSDLHTVEQFFHTISPSQPPDPNATKANKRKRKSTAGAAPAPTSQPSQKQAAETNTQLTTPINISAQPLQIPDQQARLPQAFQQLSPSSNMYNPHPSAYFPQDPHFQPQSLGIMPTLDRQLVFGAYGNIDANSLGHNHGLMDNMNPWDIGGISQEGIPGTGWNEPTSAWFMPFNMEPPDVGSEQDIFALGLGSLDGPQGYGMDLGNMSVESMHGRIPGQSQSQDGSVHTHRAGSGQG